jgi:GMP synthase-like glutamine amidotransferase
MLHCNMAAATHLQLGLEDLLADLRHARRQNDLGRLALVAYCEVRRWARDAGQLALAEQSASLITGSPHASRAVFLKQVDILIRELENQQVK